MCYSGAVYEREQWSLDCGNIKGNLVWLVRSASCVTCAADATMSRQWDLHFCQPNAVWYIGEKIHVNWSMWGGR